MHIISFFKIAKSLLNENSNLGTKEKIFFFIKVLLSLVIIIYFVYKIDFKSAMQIMVLGNHYLIGGAGLLCILNIYLQYSKWRLIVSKCLHINHSSSIFYSLMHGIAIGSFTPARLGEYIGRKIALTHATLFQITALTVIDKLFSLFVTLGFGAAATILYLHFMVGVSSYISLSLLFSFLISVMIAGYLLTHQNLWNSTLIRQIQKISLLKNIAYKLSLIKNLESGVLWRSLGLNVLLYSCFLTQYVLLLMAFDSNASALSSYWSGSLMFFAKTIIPAISLGELGIREGASMFFAKQFSIPEVAGFNAAIGIFLINIFVPSFIGMLLLFKKSDD